MNEYAKRRIAELEAMAPVKRTRREDAFAIMPLWTAALAAEATRSPALLVWAYILYRARRYKRRDCVLANGWLEKRGVNRQAKYRTLRKLEAVGLVSVEWRARRSPRITVLV
jgi:hypothetical protein